MDITFLFIKSLKNILFSILHPWGWKYSDFCKLVGNLPLGLPDQKKNTQPDVCFLSDIDKGHKVVSVTTSYLLLYDQIKVHHVFIHPGKKKRFKFVTNLTNKMSNPVLLDFGPG